MTARRFWGDADPLGRQLMIEKTTFEIIGVVGNMRYGNPAAAPAPEAFIPYEQTAHNGGTFVFRGPPASLRAVKAAIWTLNPVQPITNIRTAEEMFGRATATRRFNMLLMAIFGALALTIAVTGIYGVIAFMVGQRTREVGVRVALGARPWEVVRLFVRQGAAVVCVGIAAGTVGAWWLSRTVQSE